MSLFFGLSYAHRQFVSLQKNEANGAYPTSRALLLYYLETDDSLLPDPVVVCTSGVPHFHDYGSVDRYIEFKV